MGTSGWLWGQEAPTTTRVSGQLDQIDPRLPHAHLIGAFYLLELNTTKTVYVQNATRYGDGLSLTNDIDGFGDRLGTAIVSTDFDGDGL